VNVLSPSRVEQTAESDALPRRPSSVIPLLQAVQKRFGYISEQRLEEVAAYAGAPLSDVYGVATFYAQFRLRPPGKHLVRVCQGTACHVLGAAEVLVTLQQDLGVSEGETTRDGLFTLESVRCLGCCSLSPAVMIDDTTHGRVTPESLRDILEPYRTGGGT
jgi:NADH-quinone oxidoreductase subunit E